MSLLSRRGYFGVYLWVLGFGQTSGALAESNAQNPVPVTTQDPDPDENDEDEDDPEPTGDVDANAAPKPGALPVFVDENAPDDGLTPGKRRDKALLCWQTARHVMADPTDTKMVSFVTAVSEKFSVQQQAATEIALISVFSKCFDDADPEDVSALVTRSGMLRLESPKLVEFIQDIHAGGRLLNEKDGVRKISQRVWTDLLNIIQKERAGVMAHQAAREREMFDRQDMGAEWFQFGGFHSVLYMITVCVLLFLVGDYFVRLVQGSQTEKDRGRKSGLKAQKKEAQLAKKRK